MTPEAALANQIELYRSMTGEERLRIALELHELACNVAHEAFEDRFPTPTKRKSNVDCANEFAPKSRMM